MTAAIRFMAPDSLAGPARASWTPLILDPKVFSAVRGRLSLMDYAHVRYEQDGHVVTLTYDRPEQHNAINRAMAAELHHAWRRFRDDEDAFVLVITGAGETTFCAGWDLADAAALAELGDFDAF